MAAAARADNTAAALVLGVSLWTGHHGVRDRRLAKEWIEVASLRGDRTVRQDAHAALDRIRQIENAEADEADRRARAEELARERAEEQRREEERRARAAPTVVPGGVLVIAPSVSTGRMARAVMRELRLIEVPMRQASGVLVVVRSSLRHPLMFSYRSLQELQNDADWQPNISGRIYHVYMFTLDNNLVPHETSHQRIEATD